MEYLAYESIIANGTSIYSSGTTGEPKLIHQTPE